jgi:hypothetical protein
MRIGSISFRRLDSSLIEALLHAEAYQHAVDSIEMIETHISWVILTGRFAYKIKKPIKLGFLDFRELSDRLFYCEEEVRLNRPWAPDIYLGVVPISMRGGMPVVDGDGVAVEYAVRMRQFDQARRLDVELLANQLSARDMDELAETIARQHLSAGVIDAGEHKKKLAHIRNDMWDNLDALQGLLAADKLRTLRQWTDRQLKKLRPILRSRIDEGFVRTCHGDLHLSNLVRLPSGITAFDCIEFSDDLRNIDVMCDIAFLVMDLVSRHRPDLAYRFLNRYLEVTGDYASMQIFTLYFVYRCLVRAKVAAIRSQERRDEQGARNDLSRMQKYCDMALDRCQDRVPMLIVMHGLSGSGKTWVSSQLACAMPALRIRSDIERKRMFGLEETADSGSGVAQGIYRESANQAVYRRMHELGATILATGHVVILDAVYLALCDRQRAREIAADLGAGFAIVHTYAAEAIVRDRIQRRAGSGTEASEADLAVLRHQLENRQPLTREEQNATVHWDTGEDADIQELVRLLTDRQTPLKLQSSLAG